MKDLVVTNFGKYCKSTKEKLYSKLSKEQNLRKVDVFLYVFLTTSDEVENAVEMIQSISPDNCIWHYFIKILNLFDPEFQLI